MMQSGDGARRSGLTPHQLREWCGRRGVVIPDVPPAGRGHLALFAVFPNSQEAMLRLEGEAFPKGSCLATSLNSHLEVLVAI
jgi:hypothetical protein